jgi:UDP-galactopyranose mutase
MARRLEDVTFLGRLASYRYLDMDEVVEQALDVAERIHSKLA